MTLNLRSKKRGTRSPRLVCAAWLGMSALLLAGCQSTVTADASNLAIGISSASLEDPFQAALQTAVSQAAASEGIDIASATNANNDPSKQLTDINAIVGSGAKGMLIVPRDTSAVVPAIKEATAAGVPVVALDSTPTGGDAVITVRADSTQMGELACEQIGEALNGTGKVLELQGDLATTVGRERTDGFEQCMSERFPGIQVIAKNTQWKADLAANLAQTTLTATPDIAAIYLESDSVMLSGVLAVMKQLGLLVPAGQEGHIVIATIDGTPDALDAVRAGEVDVVISQPLLDYAKYGLMHLKNAIEGVKPEVGATSYGSRIVESDGQLEDLLPAVVVTSDNVNEDTLWGNSDG